MNAVDMYRAFRLGIDSSKTSVVSVDKWNKFINLVVLDWMEDKIGRTAFTGMVYHDLESLHVDTNGMPPLDLWPIACITLLGDDENMFYIPTGEPIYGVNIFAGYKTTIIDYPLIHHIIGVQFMIKEGSTYSTWLPARVMKADQRGFIKNNPYEEPLNSRLYFELIGDAIRLHTKDAEGVAMRLEYYRKPDQIKITDQGERVSDVSFTDKARKEIVDMAVRIYLEQKTNPRYQSYLQEMLIKQQTKI